MRSWRPASILFFHFCSLFVCFTYLLASCAKPTIFFRVNHIPHCLLVLSVALVLPPQLVLLLLLLKVRAVLVSFVLYFVQVLVVDVLFLPCLLGTLASFSPRLASASISP